MFRRLKYLNSNLFTSNSLVYGHQNFFSSSTMLNTQKVAVCQLTATNNKNANLKSVKKLVSLAVLHEVKAVFFPEATDYIATNKEESKELSESLNGPLMKEYQHLAKKNNIWISIGGFHERVELNSDVKLHNSHVLIANTGEIKSVYRKLHLFDVSIPEKNINLKESEYILPGEQIIKPVETAVGSIGLSICYDLRFPEVSTILRKLGATILTYPSAFTTTTGQAHWEVLLRARAIENQCYVIAAAQCGQHNPNRSSYGHSMIIDPWGKIVAECPVYQEGVASNESLAVATIDNNLIDKVRQEMPVFQHRRNDIYSLFYEPNLPQSIDDYSYMFSDKIIAPSTVFYRSKYCFAFTNIRCVVPGHVLVSSLRNCPRLESLTQEEIADLFQTVVKVQKVMEKHYSSSSSTICVQDGEYAGQTVSHVHCHVLPRKKGDFGRNDDIYEELSNHDRDNNPNPLRSLEEQTKEAETLRKYF